MPNFFEEMHRAVEAPMNSKMVLSAIKTLIRQSEQKELSGSHYEIAESLLVELAGGNVLHSRIWWFITTFLQPWVISEILEGSSVTVEKYSINCYRFKLGE